MLPAALFRSDTLFERPITLGDGTVHKLHFRQLLRDEMKHWRELARSDANESEVYLVGRSLCNPDGSPIGEDMAQDLLLGVRAAMASAIMEIQGIGAKMGNALPPVESSGSSTS